MLLEMETQHNQQKSQLQEELNKLHQKLQEISQPKSKEEITENLKFKEAIKKVNKLL